MARKDTPWQADFNAQDKARIVRWMIDQNPKTEYLARDLLHLEWWRGRSTDRMLFNAVDFVYRQSSLNGHQAIVDADGRFRAVISVRDPGLHNWLDPGDTTRGMLIGRWYGCDSLPTPSLRRVKFAELDRHLPVGQPKIGAEQRSAQLRARRIGAQLRRRW